jgi:hypothetical protein
VLKISTDVFEALLSTSSTAALAVLHWVMSRLSQNDALLHQQERMAALGTLSAGLAHELNNPAAAAQRSAAELHKSLMQWQTVTHEIESVAAGAGQTAWLNEFMGGAARRFEARVKLDALERIDLVDQLQAWLEANGVESAWELAPAMVNFGWNAGLLESLKTTTFFTLAIRWLGTSCRMMDLLAEVQLTTGRLSEIVHAMKSYTYLDQAPAQIKKGRDGETRVCAKPAAHPGLRERAEPGVDEHHRQRGRRHERGGRDHPADPRRGRSRDR